MMMTRGPQRVTERALFTTDTDVLIQIDGVKMLRTGLSNLGRVRESLPDFTETSPVTSSMTEELSPFHH